MARCQESDATFASAAREARDILDRYEEQARDSADRLMVEARIEAARLITDARREVMILTERAAALQQAHREAAIALDRTRHAFDDSLASVSAKAGTTPGGAPGTDLRPPITNWPVPRLPVPAVGSKEPGARASSSTRIRSRRRVVVAVLSSGALGALLTAAWFARDLLPDAAGRTATVVAPVQQPSPERNSPRTGATDRERSRRDRRKRATPVAPRAPQAAERAPAVTSLPFRVPATAVPPPAALPAVAGAEHQIRQIDRQWFESYYRGDREGMTRLSAPGFEIVDSRAQADKAWRGGVAPERTLSDVTVDVHGDGAVLSARMIERRTAEGRTHERESFISEVWVKSDGAWRMLGLRLASGADVRRAAGSLR
jgi:hypothetical protein